MQAEATSPAGFAAVTGSAVRVMPRWKMLDVVWLDHYWRPRGLVVGISRDKTDPNKISYDIVNEWEVTNYFRAEECVTEEEWRNNITAYLRDEYSPRDWRAKMERVAEFKEPPCWEEFRRRYRETGDPYLPWPDGSRPSWQIDQTYPQSSDYPDNKST